MEKFYDNICCLFIMGSLSLGERLNYSGKMFLDR